MINFDTLPNDKPVSQAEPGAYFGTIEKAEMKQPKDPSKKPYLSVTYGLTNKEGKSFGKFFDLITESEHDIARYKLKRFIVALELPLTGAFELADLTKIIVGKKLILDLVKDTKSEQPRLTVDLFTGMAFYPLSEATEKFGIAAVGEINASDAHDAPVYEEDTEY